MGFFSMLPAHAGVILLKLSYMRDNLHVTRTRGGDPPKSYTLKAMILCYPHTRG